MNHSKMGNLLFIFNTDSGEKKNTKSKLSSKGRKRKRKGQEEGEKLSGNTSDVSKCVPGHDYIPLFPAVFAFRTFFTIGKKFRG